jgi:hypothetical protein
MKKRLIIGGAIVLFGLIGIAGSSSPASQSQQTPLVQSTAPASANSQPAEQPAAPVQPAPDPTPAPTPTPTPPASSSSSAGTYTNVDGNTVQSPTQSTDGSVPAGATARCGDGSYSFSQHRSGTCSHHDGVSEWL